MIGGTHIQYYFFCKRRLWLHLNSINYEHTSDLVKEGKNIHNDSFKKITKKEVAIGRIKIDRVDFKKRIIYEIKRGNKISKPSEYQCLYYLKVLGDGWKCFLKFPKSKESYEIIMSEDKLKELAKIENEILELKDNKCPPYKYKRACNKCSFNDFCSS